MTIQKLKISKKGLELIKFFEGLHDGDLNTIGLQSKACPSGIYTVGYGHALVNPKTGKFIKSKEELKLIPAEAQTICLIFTSIFRIVLKFVRTLPLTACIKNGGILG
jgi:GH24 family phage-related lysozyme (muramidase)